MGPQVERAGSFVERSFVYMVSLEYSIHNVIYHVPNNVYVAYSVHGVSTSCRICIHSLNATTILFSQLYISREKAGISCHTNNYKLSHNTCYFFGIGSENSISGVLFVY